MSKIKNIKVSKFSNTPKGRYYKTDTYKGDGEYTGQLFRETYLEPIFDEFDKIVINLDDLYGCPSSFREEAFGGLVRVLDVDPQVVLDKLEFIATNRPPLIDIIKKDIMNAQNK